MTTASLPPVLIVGLGLIGGSVGLALRAHGVSVRGVSRSRDSLTQAQELGAIDGGSLSLADEAPRAGLILLATPTRTCIRMLQEVGKLAQAGAIITDVCSSKGEVIAAMNRLPERLLAVGGHPLAGKETPGIEAAEAGLFRRTVWALCETRSTDGHARALCEALADACGARALWTTPEDHDRAVAFISHLPLLTSAALVLAAEGSGSDLVWQLASSGFRDTTRLAAGDPQMGADVALTNARALLEALSRFHGELSRLADAAGAGSEHELLRLLATAAQRRRGMYL